MVIEPRPKRMDPSRRSFLKAVGATAVSLPFFRLLSSSISQAQSASSPLRFLVISNPLGTLFDYWRPQIPGGTAQVSASTNAFNLVYPNSILAPLSKYQSKMIVLDGIDCVPEIKYGDTGHEAAGSILTGDVFKEMAGVNPTVQSLDQFLAGQAAIGGQTTLRSLELSVGGNKYSNRLLSWGTGGAALPRFLNPWQTFQTLFAHYKPAGASADPAALNKIAQQKSVLDYVHADVARLQARLGTLERQKLDQHLQAVGDIERRLTGGSIAQSTSCSPPAQLPDQPTWQGLFAENPNNTVYFDSDKYGSFMFDHLQELNDLQLSMITQAFACDLTRVVTLQYFEDGCDGLAPWALPNVAPSDPLADPHVCSHADEGTPGRAEKMATYQNWFAQQIAKLMDQLAAIPEGNGTVLDHTLIFWTNENGGVHAMNNIPMVLLGGANGAFKMGRYLRYSLEICDNCASETTCGCSTPPTFTPHNQLLVSLANAFPGVNINSYGNTAAYNFGTGSLPNL